MAIEDIMVKRLITVPPTASMKDAARLMLENGISRIVVEKNGKGVGMLSEKDVVRFGLTDTSDRTLEEVQVKEAMTKPLISVGGNESIPIVTKLMLTKKIGSVTVTEEKSVIAGIVTKTDLCHYFSGGYVGRFEVRNFMSTKVLTIKPSHSIFYAANIMESHKVSRLIVVDDGVVVGVVTFSDINSLNPLFKPKKLLAQRRYFTAKGFIASARVLPLLSVSDIMTRNPIVVDEDEDLALAAREMSLHKISGLPVLDKSKELKGVITKTNILQAIAAS